MTKSVIPKKDNDNHCSCRHKMWKYVQEIKDGIQSSCLRSIIIVKMKNKFELCSYLFANYPELDNIVTHNYLLVNS
jgi:hypothetical protein